MSDNIFGRYYAMMECIANGYKPTPSEEQWIEFVEYKLSDWSSDVEYSF